MSFIDKPELTAPNDKGFQFGVDKSLTEYAQTEQYNAGNVLPAINYHVLQVWKNDNLITRLIVNSETNEPVKDVAGFEACAAYLDMMKLDTKASEKSDEK